MHKNPWPTWGLIAMLAMPFAAARAADPAVPAPDSAAMTARIVAASTATDALTARIQKVQNLLKQANQMEVFGYLQGLQVNCEAVQASFGFMKQMQDQVRDGSRSAVIGRTWIGTLAFMDIATLGRFREHLSSIGGEPGLAAVKDLDSPMVALIQGLAAVAAVIPPG